MYTTIANRQTALALSLIFLPLLVLLLSACSSGVAATGPEQALQRWIAENTQDLEGATITVEQVEGDFARARVEPADPAVLDPAVAYLQRENGAWTVIAVGTAFGPDFFAEHGIPAELQPQAAGELPATLAERCATAATIVNDKLGVSASAQPAPVTDPATATTAPGCRVLVEGTGAEFPSFVTVAQTLGSELAAAGWEEDMSYLADGPTGTATAFRKEGALALVNVGWHPSPDAGCPADQPITACKLSPSQQLFTISLEVMEAATTS